MSAAAGMFAGLVDCWMKESAAGGLHSRGDCLHSPKLAEDVEATRAMRPTNMNGRSKCGENEKKKSVQIKIGSKEIGKWKNTNCPCCSHLFTLPAVALISILRTRLGAIKVFHEHHLGDVQRQTTLCISLLMSGRPSKPALVTVRCHKRSYLCFLMQMIVSFWLYFSPL